MNFYRKFLLLLVSTFGFLCSQATHYRAGEILYQWINGFTYQVQVITYTKISPPSNQADRDTVTVNWGDGTELTIPRVNGPIDANGFPGGVVVTTDVKKNIYQGQHTYTGAPPNGFFVIQFYDQNRLDGVLNINFSNSVEIPFYVEDTLFIFNPSFVTPTSSPVLVSPAVQYANDCNTFYTNPDAVDSVGDSLDYRLAVCKQDPNNAVPNYQFPDAYCRANGGCNSAANTCTIDAHTGDFVWNTPCFEGIYNVGILIHIYRNGVCIGTMLRDMEIIVRTDPDTTPQLVIPNDTCVRAGDQLLATVKATDPQSGINILLTAQGSALAAPAPAQFDSVFGPPTVNGTFKWNTDCADIQQQPYFVNFEAQTNFYAIGPDGQPDLYPQIIFKTWNIQVIPPPVLGLTAADQHNGVVLNWQNPYTCADNPNFKGFTIWRKVGCDPFVPGYCETGLAGTGYVKIGTVADSVYTFTDNNVVAGEAYSYRVLAIFYKLPPIGVTTLMFDYQESVPSAEVCINAPIDVPLILNADVLNTDAAVGQIHVRWNKPLAGATNLDTLAAPPPYRFDLYHSKGLNFSIAGATLLNSNVYPSYSAIPDTVWSIDSLIDTKTTPWSYEVYFYGNNTGPAIDSLGPSAPASSVYLNIQPTDGSLNLVWNYNDPWTNDSFTVYRQNRISGVFDSVGISYTNSYPDTGLQNDTTYCYYVKAWGHYTSGLFPQPLLNRSEEDCAAPVDTVPPCPPTLTIKNDCDQYNGQPWNAPDYINHLSWVNQPDSCSLDIVKYRVYFNPSDSNNFVLLDSLMSKSDTTYDHMQNDNLAGCYAVTAVSHGGKESKFSNIVCVDNCPYYILPNAFTPNGDGINDYFTPFKPYRFVPKIEMKIFNRWGELVFETTDPAINWDGRDKEGKPVSDGVYLYAGYYYEQRLGGLVRMPLSGQKKGGGFIELMRK